MRHLFYLVLLLTLTACPQKDDDTINCTEIFVSGLTIQVKDLSTNNIITEGITVLIEDGDYNEELAFVSDTFFGAGERPGNYTITVSGEGYMTAVVGPIEVLSDECHVITQSLEIALMPN
jgi:hypothetical protein